MRRRKVWVLAALAVLLAGVSVAATVPTWHEGGWVGSPHSQCSKPLSERVGGWACP